MAVRFGRVCNGTHKSVITQLDRVIFWQVNNGKIVGSSPTMTGARFVVAQFWNYLYQAKRQDSASRNLVTGAQGEPLGDVQILPVLLCKSGAFRRIIFDCRLSCCEKQNAFSNTNF